MDCSIAFRTNPHPMWVYDPDTLAFLDVNRAAVEQYGYSADEFRRMTIADIRPADEAERLRQHIAAGRCGPNRVNPWFHVTKDGRRLTVDVRSEPTEWAGRPARLVAVCAVHPGRAEAELAAERERFAAALEAAGMLTWDRDFARDTVHYSADFWSFFGLPAAGDPVRWEAAQAAVHPDDRPRMLAAVAAAQADGGRFSVEFRGPPGQPRQRHYLSRGRVEVGADGRPTRLLGITKDATDRIEAQQRAAAAEARLVADQRNRVAVETVGGVAHSFNNLLTAVLGFTELARAGLPPGPAAGHLDQAITAAERAAELCRHLLLAAGKVKPSSGRLDLAAVAREAAGLLRAAIDRRVGLQVHTAAGLPPLRGDAEQVRQAVLQLVRNAADAAGGGTVAVQVGRRDVTADELAGAAVGADRPAGGYQWVSVTDTGPGIPADVLARVFDPGFSTKPDGPGLGLAVVRAAVAAHAGAVRVVSAAGRGTAVELLLPEG